MLVDVDGLEAAARAKGKCFPPKFIVLEGVNGAGKTTLQAGLKAALTERGHDCVVTREPGSGELGAKLRPILLGGTVPDLSPLSEVFLFAADRAQHVQSVIKPALNDGKTVLCDRYYYSTLAFQGYGRALDCDVILEMNLLAVAGVLPDLVILLDLDPEHGLARNAGTDSSSDSFEEEDVAFQHRVRNGFLEIAEKSPEPFAVLDAVRPQAEILNSALAFMG